MNILELAILKKMVGGGGGSGTDNYNDLSNLPQINGETLAGNKTAANLGLQDALTFDSAPTEDSTNPVESGGVYNALAGKQDNLTFDGVYNASTNKAATESTVTNAIAGLDVSAFSVDADETISSISETDGKISVTKQDIAIASNQVVAMTGYTKPSSAPATPAIQQDDTANAAIGKLEYKADVNQTNILYSLNTGAKNLFRWNKWVNDCTVFGGTKNIDADGKLILTSTTSNCYTEYEGFTYPDVEIAVKENEQYVLMWDYSRLAGGSRGIVYVVFEGSTGTTSASASAEVKKIEFTTPSGTTGLRIYINQTANGMQEQYYDFMICSKVIWDTLGHNYQPPSLPNADLTQLEQQDRNALVEVVDSGRKNLFDLSVREAAKTSNITVTKTSNSITVTSDTSGNEAYVSYPIIIDKAGKYVIKATFSNVSLGRISAILRFSNTATGGVVYTLTITENGTLSGEFELDSAGTYWLLFAANWSSVTAVNTYTASNIMVCTAAEFTISQNYSEYALPNYDLTQLERQDRNALVEVIDKGAKNQLTIPDIETLKALNIEAGVSTGTWSGNSFTYKGVTFTINYADNTITTSGTSTVDHERIVINKFTFKSNNDYMISGCPSGGSNSGYSIAMLNYNYRDTGGGLEVDGDNTTRYLVVYAQNSGTNMSGLTFKPMICTPDEWKISKNYEPYALPNSDLTQGLAELNAHPFFTVPINHNMIYRGKNLGDTLTDAQHTALSGGNFTDLYLGDYWTKSVTIPAGTYTGGDGEEVTIPEQTNITLKAVIADFDTFYAGYASGYAAINSHHAAVIVTGFGNVVWNGTNSTAGGYVNSLIHKWLVGSVLLQIETWFGSAKVLSHQKLLTNAITGDTASEWAWSSQKISLLSENQLYGSKVWGGSKATNGGYEPGEAFKHLNVFNHIDANLLFGNKNIWLRDIASAERSAFLGYNSDANSHDASNPRVAPAALILLS